MALIPAASPSRAYLHARSVLLSSFLFLSHTNSQTTPLSIPSWTTASNSFQPSTFATSASTTRTGTSATASPSTSTDTGGSLFSGPYTSYYYGFIALVLIAVIAGFWGIHNRRRRRKLRTATGRQTALLQDAAAWPNNRRWIHGASRGVEDGAMHTGGDEGFNEQGEAPPPYKRAESVRETEESTGESSSTRESGDMGMAMPMQALTRDGIGHKPPDYEERVRRVDDEVQDLGRSRQ